MKKDMNEERYLGYKDQNDLNKMEETLDELVEERKKVWLIEAVAYIRYSSHMQDNGVSVEYQIQAIEEYSARNGIRITEWFIDKAVSGKTVEGRDEFNRMFKLMEAGETPPRLIVYSTSRAFRDAADSAIYRANLRKMNIELLSATQPIDDKTINGRLLTDIMARLDQYKVEEIGEHVAAATKLLISEGFSAGGTSPYGFKAEAVIYNGKQRIKLVPHEPEAAIVRELFNSVIAGVNVNQFAMLLYDRGVVGRKGKPINREMLRRMLSNIIYKGERLYRMKNGVNAYCQDYCEPIVSKEVFDAANRIYDNIKGKTKSKTKKHIYPLTGCAVCSHCGKAVIGYTANNYNYYMCNGKYKVTRCEYKRMPKKWLEEIAFNAVKENILSDRAIEDITKQVLAKIKKAPVFTGDKKELSAKKSTLEKEIAEIVQMKLSNKISESVMDMMTKEKEAELSAVIRKLSQIKMAEDKTIDAVYIKKRINAMFNRKLLFDECTPEMLKALFMQTIEKIEVGNTQVVIHLRLFISENNFNPTHETPDVELKLTIDRTKKKRGQ